MHLFSRIKRRIGFLVLDYLGVKAISAQKALSDRKLQEQLLEYMQEPPPTLYTTGIIPAVTRERDTDGIDERAVAQALKSQAIKAKPLEVEVVKGLIGNLPAGELTRMYRDAHRERETGEMTQEHRAIRRAGKLENRGKQ